MFWLFCIIRIAYNIVFANVVVDVRSDEEDDGEGGRAEGKGKNAIGGSSQEETNGRGFSAEEQSFVQADQGGKKDL